MNQLIIVNYNNDKQTTSGRELHGFLEVESNYTTWFKRMTEYGFIEGADFITCLPNMESEFHGGQNKQDHQLTIDMAKEIAMLQRTDKGKEARQYFLQIEKAWNSPEAVMARAMRIANVKLISLQSTVELLDTENKLLAQQQVKWADRKVINALVQAYGNKIGFEAAWHDYKKELLYNHGINIQSRMTKKINDTGKKVHKKLDMIHDDEVSACISTAVALCRTHNIKIDYIIKKFNMPA
jgi:anti-repressor protein